MIIQVFSDIHTEFHHDWGREFVAKLDPTGVDVLAVAGDLGTRLCLPGVLDGLCRKYPHVVYVTGNHEYYHITWQVVDGLLDKVRTKHPNFHRLRDSAVTIDGQRFVGGTLWFSEDPVASTHRQKMNDFSVIKDFEPGVYHRNRRAQAFLRKTVEPGDVVVTHHIPSRRLITPRWRNSPLNPFFVCDMTDLIERAQPKLWIYGHTHDSLVDQIGETLMVCNPLGYAGIELNPNFQEKFLVEVGPEVTELAESTSRAIIGVAPDGTAGRPHDEQRRTKGRR